MRRLLFVLVAALSACAQQFPDRVTLSPQAENVEFATEPPSKNTFKLLGEVTGQAVSNDPDVAQQGARNDLRNNAAALGASLVTIDEDLGDLEELDILVDGSGPNAYLLQVFLRESAGLFGNPEAGPFFFEIIQRKGDMGFGAGNFRALFESIERQQSLGEGA